jgi:hypothetical protein
LGSETIRYLKEATKCQIYKTERPGGTNLITSLRKVLHRNNTVLWLSLYCKIKFTDPHFQCFLTCIAMTLYIDFITKINMLYLKLHLCHIWHITDRCTGIKLLSRLEKRIAQVHFNFGKV